MLPAAHTRRNSEESGRTRTHIERNLVMMENQDMRVSSAILESTNNLGTINRHLAWVSSTRFPELFLVVGLQRCGGRAAAATAWVDRIKTRGRRGREAQGGRAPRQRASACGTLRRWRGGRMRVGSSPERPELDLESCRGSSWVWEEEEVAVGKIHASLDQ